MKIFLKIVFTLDFLGLCAGLCIKSTNEAQGKLIIGLSLVVGFFILMPLFIYHRWKDRDVKDYMLTKESIQRMRDYNNSDDSEE